jgi:hypothetical protein
MVVNRGCQQHRGCQPTSWRNALIGSMRTAREAGTRHAASAAAPRTSAALVNVTASEAVTSKSMLFRTRVSANAPVRPTATRTMTGRETRPTTNATTTAQRHAKSDLLGALRDNEAHDSLNANGCQHHRVPGERRHEQRVEPLILCPLRAQRAEAAQVGNRKACVEIADGGAHRREQFSLWADGISRA